MKLTRESVLFADLASRVSLNSFSVDVLRTSEINILNKHVANKYILGTKYLKQTNTKYNICKDQ